MVAASSSPTSPGPCHRLQTGLGVIDIYAQAAREFLAALSVDFGIGAFWNYKEGERQKETLLKALACGGRVAAAVRAEALVGFLLTCPPGPGERWAGVAGVYDTSFEVSRHWRQLGVAGALFAVTFADPKWERRVVVSTGYHYHWDIEYNGLCLWSYRELFIRLHEVHGFRVFDTDDPEVACECGNVLMARIGARCSPALCRAFYEDLYRGPRRPEWLRKLLDVA